MSTPASRLFLCLGSFGTARSIVAASIVGILSLACAPHASAQANLQGQWQTLPNLMPINPVHVALLHNGRVLVVSGSGNLPTVTNYQAAIFDPATGTVTTQPVGWDMFCNGMVVLSDGRAFVNGGTLQYDPFHGQPRSAAYDPSTGQFTDVQNMSHGRWYPTVTNLSDGTLMTFSGLDENSSTNSTVEIYTVGSGWSTTYGSPFTPPLYPRMHLLPSGKVFYSGSTTGSRYFDPSAHTWSGIVANTNYSGTRTYGTSVLLPLTPANNYKPVVMILGGGNPATNTTELIDLSAGSPHWVYGPNMSQSRIEMNATLLPNGKLIALGGSLNDEDTATASLKADLYDPASNMFSSAGQNVYARLYHSNSLLLPDARVLVVGGNPSRGTYEQHIEIYTPAYLFKSDGTAAARPSITGVPSTAIGYGSAFQVQTPDAANISFVRLIRPGAPTHAFDMEQRLVELSFTVGSGALNVIAPPNGNIAPPGYYMLFLLNSAGVPSVAQFVQLSLSPADVPPTGTITSPTGNVTITAGQSVLFSGTGSDPDGTITGYSWTFSGGNPSTSSLATPGNVTYSSPGTFTATFTVTDNANLTDPTPPTRTITVNSTQAAAITSAGSTTFAVGTAGTFTVTTTGTPTPALSETGALPSGVTFKDNGNGTATLGGTPAAGSAGSYPITITASNGVGTPANQSFALTVSQVPTITSANNTTFAVGTAGTFTVTTTGTPTPSLSETGALPNGVTFKDNGNGTATLGGTPASGSGGTYSLTLTASNGVGTPANQSFTLTVNNTQAAAAITSANNTTFAVGTAGTFTVTTTGTPTPSLSETGALPNGVTFKDNGNGTATLGGTPAAGSAGSYSITIKAHNGVGTDASQSFALRVKRK